MSATKQFTRFAVVGLVSNLALYLIYLLLTTLGLGHKLAMSNLYMTGVLQTFFFNRGWTFSHRGPTGPALTRYVIAYALGYLINLLALVWLVDTVGLPHQAVQGAMILLMAVGFFLAQRYWIFRENDAYTI
jgi:putative flippase GtrA